MISAYGMHVAWTRKELPMPAKVEEIPPEPEQRKAPSLRMASNSTVKLRSEIHYSIKLLPIYDIVLKSVIQGNKECTRVYLFYFFFTQSIEATIAERRV